MTFFVPGFGGNARFGGFPAYGGNQFGVNNYAGGFGGVQGGGSKIIGGGNSSPFPSDNSGMMTGGFGSPGFGGMNGMGGMEGLMQLMSTLMGMIQMMMGMSGQGMMGQGGGCPSGRGQFGGPQGFGGPGGPQFGGGYGGNDFGGAFPPGGSFGGPGGYGDYAPGGGVGGPSGGYGGPSGGFGGPGGGDYGGLGFPGGGGYGGPRAGGDYGGGALGRFPRGGRFESPDGPRGERPHGPGGHHGHSHGPSGPVDPDIAGAGLARLPSGHLFNARGVEAFNRAAERAARDGVRIQVNSAYRSDQRQAELYRQLAGRQAVARPGSSTHNGSRGAVGIDIQNWQQARPYLEAEGFVWRNHRNDPFHFDYVGGGSDTRVAGGRGASGRRPSTYRASAPTQERGRGSTPQQREPEITRASYNPGSSSSSSGSSSGSSASYASASASSSNDSGSSTASASASSSSSSSSQETVET